MLHAFERLLSSAARGGAAALGLMACAGATSVQAQKLDEASGWALRSSLSIAADDARQDAAQARLRGSIDAFMPTVSIVGERILRSTLDYHPDVPVPVDIPDATARHQPNTYGIQASLPLFDGFKRLNELRAARSAVTAGRHLQVAARQQVLLDTATAYLAVLRDRQILDLRHKQVADTELIARTVAAKLAVQDMTFADQALAASRVEAAKVAREQARAQLEATTLEFRRLTGVAPSVLSVPVASAELLPRSPEEFEAELLRANPKLNAARLDVDAAHHLADAAKAQFLPQANLVASLFDQRDITQVVKRVRDKTVKLQVRIPIYEPGAFPKASEAKALARQKSYEFQDNQRKAVSDALALFATYHSMSTQIAQARRRTDQIQRVVTNYRIEQGIGLRTVVDILNARAELTEAMITKSMLEFDHQRQKYTLAAALGRLT